jgi:hypothetical protein
MRAGDSVHDFVLQACARSFTIRCGDIESADVIRTGFGELFHPAAASSKKGRILIARSASDGGFTASVCESRPVSLVDADALLFYVDKWLTLSLQRSRPDLYFLHAGAVASRGRVAVLVAPSGAGKSTLAYALLTRRFEYLSDELAPIDTRTRRVWPYPHALCLKSVPPEPYRLPPGAVRTGRRFHVPVTRDSAPDPLPMAAVFFVRRTARSEAICRPVSAAVAAAHMTASALNPLAHPRGGLDVAMTLGRSCPCFELDSSNLPAACDAVETILATAAK